MSSLMEETYHYLTSTSWKCCLRCYFWNQIIPRNPLGSRIENWELRIKKWIKCKLLNEKLLEISSKACLFLWWQELIIVVKDCHYLHPFVSWLLDVLDCFIRLVVRLFELAERSYPPPYIAYPPFSKVLFNATTPLPHPHTQKDHSPHQSTHAEPCTIQTKKDTQHTQGSIEWHTHVNIY